jgi:hypothetical protein
MVIRQIENFCKTREMLILQYDEGENSFFLDKIHFLSLQLYLFEVKITFNRENTSFLESLFTRAANEKST